MRTGCGELFGLEFGRVKAADVRSRQSMFPATRGNRDLSIVVKRNFPSVQGRGGKSGRLFLNKTVSNGK